MGAVRKLLVYSVFSIQLSLWLRFRQADDPEAAAEEWSESVAEAAVEAIMSTPEWAQILIGAMLPGAILGYMWYRYYPAAVAVYAAFRKDPTGATLLAVIGVSMAGAVLALDACSSLELARTTPHTEEFIRSHVRASTCESIDQSVR